MGKDNQRVTITKRLLHEALLRLLEKKELPKVNITELCGEAGINRVTFYRHYETPHDVLLEIEQDLLQDLHRRYPLPRSLPEVRKYLENVCAYLDQRAGMLRLIIRNNTDQDFYKLFSNLFHDWLQGSNLDAVLGSLDPEALNIISIYSAGGSYFVLRQWLLGNIKKSSQEIAAISYDLLCNTDWLAISKQFGLQ